MSDIRARITKSAVYDSGAFDIQIEGEFGFDAVHAPIFLGRPNWLFLRTFTRSDIESLILQLTGQLAKLDEEAKANAHKG